MQQAVEGDAITDAMVGHWDACLGCMACVTACPSGVQYDRLIEETRAEVEWVHQRSAADRALRGLIFALFPHQSAFVVPASAVVPVPEGVPARRAVLAGVVETAVTILWDAAPLVGDRIAVVGAGMVGCCLARLAHGLPGADVTLVDVDPARRSVADGLGVRFSVPEDAPRDQDLVVNTSGSEAGLRLGLETVVSEGEIVEASWYGDRAVTLPLGEDFHSRRLTIRSSQVGAVPPRRRDRRSTTDRLRLALDRVEKLHEQKIATDDERDAARAEHAMAAAQVEAAEVALSRARRNLGYATIKSPIDGTVIRRDVEVGQTVNAGLSAPKLFLLAGDLARMHILANVDESDIGRIREGQAATFTVQAYPERTFEGTVRQVRLESDTTESVVTYTVVVDVDNDVPKAAATSALIAAGSMMLTS